MRKKILLISAIPVPFLVVIVLTKTICFSSKQVHVDPVTVTIPVNREQISEHLAQALRLQTVSYQEAAQFDGNEFLNFQAYLRQTFPEIHSVLTNEIVERYSLLFTWKGREAGLKPILLMAHLDVVPVEQQTASAWTYPPFEGHIAEGYIWGRGALDDKANVLGILEAVDTLLREEYQPRRTIYLAFGHDEEVGGQKGASKIAALLESRGVELDYVLDEGGAIGMLPGVAIPIALVGIAEKGYVSIELTARGNGGPASAPPRHTAIGILSAAIHKLEEHQIPGKIEGPVRQMLEYIGPEVPFPRKMVLANLWLFDWLIERQLAALPATDALIRTTTAATIIQGGVKENVLPVEARAVVNFRIRPGDSIANIMDHVYQTLEDLWVDIRVFGSTLSEPSRESNPQSVTFQVLQRTIRQVFPKIVVAPSLVIATTDARHYAAVSANIYRFRPWQVDSGDLSRIHGIDERISVDSYEQYVKFYMQLIRNSDL